MQLKKLTDHIYYSEHDTSGDRPVLGYIAGGGMAVMVDAGNSAAHSTTFLKLLQESGLKKPDVCVITHWHWDHTFGLHSLDMETYAHPKTNEKLREMGTWEWNDNAMRERVRNGTEITFADENIRIEYADLTQIKVIPAVHSITDETVFDCGGILCRCLHLPSAHSDDSIVVYVPEEKVLFIGDIYGDDFYHDHSRSVEKTKALHDALAELDFSTAIPGHSQPIPKENLLQFLRGFLSE